MNVSLASVLSQNEKNQSVPLEQLHALQKNTILNLSEILQQNEINFIKNEERQSFNSNLDANFEDSKKEIMMQAQFQIFRMDITRQILSGSNNVSVTLYHSKLVPLIFSLNDFEKIKNNNQFKVFNEWLISNGLCYKAIYQYDGGGIESWVNLDITSAKPTNR